VNPTGAAFAAAMGSAAIAGLVGLLVAARWRSRLVGALLAIAGGSATFAGSAAVTGHGWDYQQSQVFPPVGLELGLDALSGWFVALVGAVVLVVGVYTIGYAGRGGHGASSRGAMSMLPLFVAALLLVPAAGSVATFLLAWELMAVTSLLLVVTEHRHNEPVRAAAVWYAAMTQAGFVAVLFGLLWLWSLAGGDFATIRAHADALSPAARSAVFLLCLFGFAAKAGAVPLHPWLPRAHAEAPSHVSALMSAAMVKLGVYGLLRVGFDLLGGGPSWWWLVVTVLGALSALYGIMQAAVASDLKRLLAFSTSENVGLILMGVGFAGMLAAADARTVAGLALAAALLHSVNHAGFKTLLFLGAGSVVKATGTRDLDGLGGLSRRMPATTLLVAVGALAAAALPPGNGFVSEWLLLQSLLHQPGGSVMLAIAAPVAVAVVALTAGVGVATYVKALGTGFLARPRSPQAATATESPASMVAAMGLAALACAALAVVPGSTVNAVSAVIGDLRLAAPPLANDPVRLQLTGITVGFWPLWLAVAVVATVSAVAFLSHRLGRPRRRVVAWDCGDGPLTSRMEYTATSFAEPLQRVFDDTLAPERDVDVTHDAESAYHIEAIRFQQRIPDRVENRLYRPLINAMLRLGDRGARALAPGSIHRYLAYMLTAFIVLLVSGVLR
jgi:formate hydrogenlyase subunit 3/multisubunit Na+/H+ antiporter MnhD subunit